MIKALTDIALGFKFEVDCTLEVSNTFDSLHAHTTFDGILQVEPGDDVHVHGAPVTVGFGEMKTFNRKATVTRAGLFQKAWIKMTGNFDFANLRGGDFSERAAL